MRYLPEDNLRYPVLIKIGASFGSGFYLNFNNSFLYLVTAYHVLFDLTSHNFHSDLASFTSYEKDNPLKKNILKAKLQVAQIITDQSRDIALILIGTLEDEMKIKWDRCIEPVQLDPKDTIVTVNFSSFVKFADVLESNEVFVLGYPTSLNSTKQLEEGRPLLRKGIVAGKNYKNKTVILDCPIYFGSSGGLAIQVEDVGIGKRNFKILGIVTQYIPFIEKLKSLQMGYVNTNFENSGYSVAIPCDVISSIIEGSYAT